MSVPDGGRLTPPLDASEIALSKVQTDVDFAHCLDQLRLLAGPLSHRQIESRGCGRLRRTKIGQVLGGELPRREFLLAYLDVCGVPADAVGPWLRVWTRLISTPRRRTRPAPATVPDDNPVASTIAPRSAGGEQAASTLVTRVPEPTESVLRELRRLRAERDTADKSARQAAELCDATSRRLRATEVARDDALVRARWFEEQLDGARAVIADLSRTVQRLRDNQTGDQEQQLESAKQEIASLREQLQTRSAADGVHRRSRYTQGDPTVFRSSDPAGAPVIGE